MITIETRWPWHFYTGTREELIAAGHATPDQFPQGRKRNAYERAPGKTLVMRHIEKLKAGLYILKVRMPDEYWDDLEQQSRRDPENRIDRVLKLSLDTAVEEKFMPLSEAEKQKLSEDELLAYEIREIIGDSLYEWNYEANSLLKLKKHHYAAPAANE